MNGQNQVPQSIEAEQGVIGALLRFNDSVDTIADLQGKHFFREGHREIFAHIVLIRRLRKRARERYKVRRLNRLLTRPS